MLLSSALYAPALVLQHKGTQQSIGQFSSGRPKFLDLLKNRVWLSGLILFYVAAVVHIVAISLGSLAVVQPLIVTELIFVPIAAMIISKTAVPGRNGWPSSPWRLRWPCSWWWRNRPAARSNPPSANGRLPGGPPSCSYSC